MKLINFKILPFILAGSAFLALSGCGKTGIKSDSGITEPLIAPLPADITIDNAALQKAIGSIIDTTPYAIDVQGVIGAGGLTVTVPYTVVNAPVTLPAFSTSVTLDDSVTEDGEAGIVATFAWTEKANLPVGSGTFTATITIDDSAAGIPDNTYNAKKLDIQDDIAGVVAATFPYATDDAGGAGALTLKIYPGIPDRMFGTVDNNGNANTHMHLYLPVTNTTTGKTWLNNNLGSNYANINDPAFDIAQQTTATNDYNAYGSLFQWGRKADGHELITWTDGSTGTAVNSTTTTQSDNPADALYVINGTDWRVTQDDNLWNGETAVNAVCPEGYRVPTKDDLYEEKIDAEILLSYPGYRDNANGNITAEGVDAYYFASDTNGTQANVLSIVGGVWATSYPTSRSFGMSIRCIQNEQPQP